MASRISVIAALAALCAAAGLFASSSVRAADPVLQVAGPETVIFSWAKDRCAIDNIPDLPARAFRDAAGQVHLVVSSYASRQMSGPTLNRLKPDCRIIQASHRNRNPQAFDDQRWLASLYTLDGKTVYALNHVEYQGHVHKGMCPSGAYFSCWYNALTLTKSTDGGLTFSSPPAASQLVATVPFPYAPDGGPVGMFSPSNIVRSPRDGAYYAIAREIGPQNTPRGACLLRTTNIADPRAWRGWDGAGFGVTFVDPYHDVPGSTGHLCVPVATPEISDMSQSLTYNTVLDRFLLVGVAGDWDPRQKRVVWGIYYALSADLVQWTRRRLLFEVPLPWTYQCGGVDPVLYPSLLDPASPSRSFDTTGASGYLYYTRFHYRNCRQTWDRDLVRVPVTLRG